MYGVEATGETDRLTGKELKFSPTPPSSCLPAASAATLAANRG